MLESGVTVSLVSAKRLKAKRGGGGAPTLFAMPAMLRPRLTEDRTARGAKGVWQYRVLAMQQLRCGGQREQRGRGAAYGCKLKMG